MQLPVVHYDIACLHAVRASYHIERALICTGNFSKVEELAAALRPNWFDGDRDFWKANGNEWPEWFSGQTRDRLVKLVEKHLAESVHFLQTMVTSACDHDPHLSASDFKGLINKSTTDIDLKLLWSYTKSDASQEYSKWLGENESSDPVMRMYEGMQRLVPKEFRERIAAGGDLFN
jgi:hypothetical protein